MRDLLLQNGDCFDRLVKAGCLNNTCFSDITRKIPVTKAVKPCKCCFLPLCKVVKKIANQRYF